MLVALLVAAGLVWGEQDSLARAKALYASAAYEDALSILDVLHGTPHKPAVSRDVAVYRVFCLMALDRDAEAAAGIQAIVRADPLFHPSEAQASPRLRARFDEVRRPLLPVIATQTLARARAALDQRDFAAAIAGFDVVIALSKEIGAQNPDLHSIASGLREVARAAEAAGPAPPLPIAGRVYGPDMPGITPPVITSQDMPALPPGMAIQSGEIEGLLEVVIDPSGGVRSARLLKGLLAGYDELLVEAARKWRFRPALLGGVPVLYRHPMVITLRH